MILDGADIVGARDKGPTTKILETYCDGDTARRVPFAQENEFPGKRPVVEVFGDELGVNK